MIGQYFDNVEYVGCNAKRSVLMLHGTPGNYQHFNQLIAHLTGQGVRVIAPNFPDISLTRQSKYFRHSPEEKAEYIKTLAATIGVTDYDCMLTHSSGVYTGCVARLINLLTLLITSLCVLRDAGVTAWQDKHKIGVKSFMWLNPCGLDILTPMRPVWLIRGMVKTYQTDFGAQLLDAVGVTVAKLAGNAFATSTPRDAVWGATTNHYTTRSKVRLL